MCVCACKGIQVHVYKQHTLEGIDINTVEYFILLPLVRF